MRKNRLTTKLPAYVTGLLLCLCCAPYAQAQVTMGDAKAPEEFSVLELISDENKGLRLPLMTTAERNGMTAGAEFQSEKAGLAEGLTIYNTTIHCLEYWNGKEWIANCTGRTAPRSRCGAYIAAGEWREFMCYNLGANLMLDPFMPDEGLHGAKYKFGAKEASLTMADDQATDMPIPNWGDLPYQATGDWLPENNPCPAGFHIPTQTEWQGVINNALNPQTPVGTWTGSATNYGSGRYYGDRLFLPATGYRGFTSNSGTLYGRGNDAYYWASTEGSGAGTGISVYMESGGTTIEDNLGNTHGFPVRCMKDAEE